MSRRVYIKTFGCQMNVYDSARMADLLAARLGYQEVFEPGDADLIILNTCHVREKAEEKLFSELGRLRKLTHTPREGWARSGDDGGSRVIFAVGGCVGQAEGRGIFRRAPYVDLVFGPQDYHRLPDWLQRLEAGERRIGAEAPPLSDKFEALPANRLTGPVGSVTIQEGCDKFCTYCVVPHTRGGSYCRPVAAVVAEVEGLVALGAMEVQLLGQNVNAYRSLGEDGVVYDLALLIRRVALLPGVRRIRFVTSHPADMNEDLVAVFAEVEALSPYLHLPIQSGADRILARMGRGHTVADYLTWVAKLRRSCPGIALASDFIVGFPGESEEDFQQTLALVAEVGYDHGYSFKFSPRPGTEAGSEASGVAPEVMVERLARLQECLNGQQLVRNRARVGQVESVLVEGWSRLDEKILTGRTPAFRKVNFAGEGSWIGQIKPVLIREGLPNSLRGEVVADG